METVLSIVSLLIALVSAIAAYVYYRNSRKYMELTYEVAPTLSLLRVKSEIRDKVRVEYEGKQITDLSGVSVEIRNTGTEPVEFSQASDPHGTQTPITLDFGRNTRILGEPNVETSPENLGVSITKDPRSSSRIIVDKFLLNPGQSATISAFLTNYTTDKLTVSAQIKGVPPLQALRPEDIEKMIARRATIFTIGTLVPIIIFAILFAVIATYLF